MGFQRTDTTEQLSLSCKENGWLVLKRTGTLDGFQDTVFVDKI